MSKMTFKEIYERYMEYVQAREREGKIAILPHETYLAITENFESFTPAEKRECIKLFFDIDKKGTDNEKERGQNPTHRCLKILWSMLPPRDREYYIKYAEENKLDFAWDSVAEILGNEKVKAFLKEHGFSNEILVKTVYRYKALREFEHLSEKELELRRQIAIDMGFSEEDIKGNPILLTMRSEILNARKNVYETVTGKQFSISREVIKFLTIPDRVFEADWGDKIRTAARDNHPDQFERFFPNGMVYMDYPEEDRIQRTYAMTQAIHRKEQRTREEEVAERLFADGIAAGEIRERWEEILPKGKGKSVKAKNKRVEIGLSGTAEDMAEKNAFWSKLIEKVGSETKIPGLTYSRKDGKKVHYLVLDVGEYTVLEPVGQVDNATYVIPSEFKPFLEEFTRKDVTELGIGFPLPHQTKLGRYRYDADRLITIIESLERYQADGMVMSNEAYFEHLRRAKEMGKFSRESFAESHVLDVMTQLGLLEGPRQTVKKDLAKKPNSREEID